MNNIEIIIGGKTLSFRVEIETDTDHGAPWDKECGHGPVSDWESRDKLPGELVLNSDRNSKRFYDFSEACKIALRDGWGLPEERIAEWTESAGRAPTKRQVASAAALADFENLKAWCNDEWQYVGIVVTLLDDEGEPTEVRDSLWGVSNQNYDYVQDEARRMADELAGGMGVIWGIADDRQVVVDGVTYTFDDDSVLYDGEEGEGLQFWFYHKLANPTADDVAELIRANLPSGGAE